MVASVSHFGCDQNGDRQMRRRMSRRAWGAILLSATLVPAVTWVTSRTQSAGAVASVPVATPIHHVIVIMEENHSFDNYFGTFPGANGIPSGVCIPDPAKGGCSSPYHMITNYTHDLSHNAVDVPKDIDGGKMDGFVADEQKFCKCSSDESLGYFTNEDIPDFWRYAGDYTLSDNLFDSIASWSYPTHLGMVSDWSALCTSPTNPMSCTATPYLGADPLDSSTWPANSIPWTDITWLLHRYGVSWGYYVAPGTEPDCVQDPCTTGQGAGTPSMWNPLPWFEDVQQDGQLGNIRDINYFYTVAASGQLPEVSWIVPNTEESGHPGVSTNADSETYVVKLINAIESSPEWSSTAIFLAWDDWGGEYDHVVPPSVDINGFGLRVPSILISPYAKQGYVDPQLMSFDSYNKFIEDNFMGGTRLNPATDERPDSRKTVREALPILGNFLNDFNFEEPPSPPVLLPTLAVPQTLVPGTSISLTGEYFQPGDMVTVTFNCGAPDCSGGVVAARVRASADGAIAANVTVPLAIPFGQIDVSAAGSNPLTYFGVTQAEVQ